MLLELRRIRRRSSEQIEIIFSVVSATEKHFSRSERTSVSECDERSVKLFFRAQRSGSEKSECTFSSAGRAPDS